MTRATNPPATTADAMNDVEPLDREQLRRPVLRNAGTPTSELDLSGCVLAVSHTALASLAIRLKQIDGLNHNAVIVGPSHEHPGQWRVTEAIADGCVTRTRALPRGYIIRFEDEGLRKRISDAAEELGDKEWGYDYASIVWHMCDFGLWAVPAATATAATWRAASHRRGAKTLALLAIAINPVLRVARGLVGRFDKDDRKICSELTIEILDDAGVDLPPWLRPRPDSSYRPTPIDLTRWLLGRDDWDHQPSTTWSWIKRIVGVHYSVSRAPEAPSDASPVSPPRTQVLAVDSP